jgi:hypothetical protein
MLDTIIILLILLWLLGFGFNIAAGGIHLLLVIAVILLLARLIQGRTP